MNKSELSKIIFGMLNANVTHRERESLMKFYLDVPNVEQRDHIKDIEKINKGVPIQYVCNHSFFYGLDFFVNENVLIPRPETEELVYWILQDHKYSDSKSIVDLGTGSACILVSVLKNKLDWNGLGVDVSEKALEVAILNGDKYQLQAEWMKWDILHVAPPIDMSNFDIWVSNPPYILQSEKSRMDGSVVAYEPAEALFVADDDALIFYKHIIELFEKIAQLHHVLYFETSDLYHEELRAFVESKSMKYEFRKDLQGSWRMLKISKS